MGTLITLASFALLAFLFWDAFKAHEREKERSREIAWIYKKFGYNINDPMISESRVQLDWAAEKAWKNWVQYGIDVPDFVSPKEKQERIANYSKQKILGGEELEEKSKEYYLKHGKNFFE